MVKRKKTVIWDSYSTNNIHENFLYSLWKCWGICGRLERRRPVEYPVFVPEIFFFFLQRFLVLVLLPYAMDTDRISHKSHVSFFPMRRGGLRISSSSVWERKQMTKWTSPMRKCGRDVNIAQSPYLSSLLKSVSFRYQNSCLSVRSLSCACVYEIKNSVRIIDNVPPVVSFCCSQLCCRSASFAVNASLSTSFL